MTRIPRRRVLESAAVGAAALTAAFAGCPLVEDGRPEERELTTPVDAPDGEWPDPDWRPADGIPSEDDVEPTTVVSDLEIPWDLAFAGDEAFITERDGGVRRFDAAALAEESGLTPADGETVLAGEALPDRAASGEGGTLGVAPHPDYPDSPLVYIYYTADDGGLRNRVVRYDLETDSLERILEGIPGASTHDGGRIAFGPDGRLWVLTGDAGNESLAQDPGSLAGAVLRITADGEPAPDNPDWGDGSDPRTYTLGHRNPQGIDFTPAGAPLIAEHGPQSRDEVSLLRPGGNYGWDVVRGGPNDPKYAGYGEREKATPPLLNTGPDDATWAPSGIEFYDDGTIQAWRNRLFVAGLVSETLFAVSLEPSDNDGSGAAGDDESIRFDADWLDDRFAVTARPLFDGEYGRLRTVETGPDGSPFLLTSNRDGRAQGAFPREDDDRIVRLDPA
ncbi:PQQ-dependent sugar dehydrogenase [Natrialbaceae archaeon GCM10025810]|uniref:PQQ-dependent sugar dehydrogenase n=1 Tax=Halovalidus salilacus TaxID=3075124 RepID=UPI003614A643